MLEQRHTLVIHEARRCTHHMHLKMQLNVHRCSHFEDLPPTTLNSCHFSNITENKQNFYNLQFVAQIIHVWINSDKSMPF